MSKSWSYLQLTRQLEKYLAELAQSAAQARSEDERSGADIARLMRYEANGAFRLWKRTAEGWIQPDDWQRMEQLVKSVHPLHGDDIIV